jgi:hypothetical protein
LKPSKSEPQKEKNVNNSKSAKKVNESESRSKPYYIRKCSGTKWTKEEVSYLVFHSC